ncbi:hypothetical protein OAU56_05165 [Nitrosopumilus sp.]|nr:hypothetical protein [Nitrosopumilus sp.]
MSNISSIGLSSFKYVYLIAFFALLSGIFYPIMTNSGFENTINGILVLFLSLAGGVLLYKTTTSETKREIFFVVGFILIGISTYLIFQLTGRV